MNIEDMAAFCKRKGFIYQSGEIYGGIAGFFDYGPLGVEVKQNIKAAWWKAHVQQRDDVVGIDGSIITHPKVWEASGHIANFHDLMLVTKKTKTMIRADHFIEDKLKIPADGLSAAEINALIKKHKLQHNKEDFKELKDVNLMFRTNVGQGDGSTAYLRPETAQTIFANFKLVQDNSRLKLPFGIAQMGKAFRNEISPRDFLFRSREFEQMEMEYFINPKDNKCPCIKEFADYKMQYLSSDMQEKNRKSDSITVSDLLKKKIISDEWLAYWIAFEHNWFVSLGVKKENLRIRQHLNKEKSHYAKDTWDLEFQFPFGWKELGGIANRSDFDLQQHIKTSGKDLSYFDAESKEKIVPHVVAEPSQGVDRAFLAFMFDAYEDDKTRGNVVLKIHPTLAPYKAAVFPLLSNKPELIKKARGIFDELKQEFPVFYDQGGTIGRRYARQDEVGTPLCITIDFDSLEDDTVTIRDRDTTDQIRVKSDKLTEVLRDFLKGTSFKKLK